MSLFRLILASLSYYRRSHLAMGLGAAAATAVLTGALLVGDSMWASLRQLALVRLGRVEEALLSQRFFREGLADELANDPGFRGNYGSATPVLLLTCSLSDTDGSRRANQVSLIGCHDRFWTLDGEPPASLPGSQQLALNRALADQLGIEPGESVLLHLPAPSTIPADSPLGRKQETVRAERLTVSTILPEHGPGQFSLRFNQQAPLNAYVPLRWLQERIQKPGRANAILVAGKKRGLGTSLRLEDVLQQPWQPALADYELRLRRSERGYWQITSERMLIEPALEAALLKALAAEGIQPQPALTYLANAIVCDKREIPYSTVTALDFSNAEPLGPFLNADGSTRSPLVDDQIALNQWAAEQLRARPGDTIRLGYFEPESTHGEVRQQWAEFRLAAVLRMEGAAIDRDLTPEVAGVTDADSIANWDAPFPFDAKRIRPQDEQYWDRYHATPKAFVSLATGRRLWGSRFGQTTALRLTPPENITPAKLDRKLRLPPASLGMTFQPVKEQALAAAKGTTSFSVLFLAFSFFTIAAAAMLVALLFRLSVEARASQLGLLSALGWSRRRIARWMFGEGMAAAALGSLAGMLLGVGYAALMLAGLQSWWLAAITTPFLHLYVDPQSLWIGLGSGLLLAAAAIGLSLRRALHAAPRPLLAGMMAEDLPAPGRSRRMLVAQIALLTILLAAVAVPLAWRADEQTRGELFFSAAAAVLAAMLGLVWIRLRTGRTGPAVAVGRANLARMAVRSAARNPGRSALSVGLVAAAVFLIASVSAFHIDPYQQTVGRETGNGGFSLVAESTQPIYLNLDTPEGRSDAGISPACEPLFATSKVLAMAVHSGDDASCLNLYQSLRPRVLGIPRAMIQRGGFAWDSSLAQSPEEEANPWLLLTAADRFRDPSGTARVPVVLEKNTAVYALHLTGGAGSLYDLPDGRGGTIPLIVVGLLNNSVLQGDLLIDEVAFRRLFPEVNGRQFFLIDTPVEQSAAVVQALQRDLGDFGIAVQTSGQRLAAFVAVQNTYLSAFQSLGGLGLLLGTLGLGAVQMRNVLERRHELALLAAVGFRPAALAWMILLENALLLTAGLGCGLLAALVAVMPHLLVSTATLPWSSLTIMLALVLVVGLLANLGAVRAVLAKPLLPALRGE